MAERQYTDPQRPHRREHHLRTPTGELSHEQKLARQRRQTNVLTVILLVVLAMLAYAAAFDLDHWAEWVVLGGICLTALGFIVAVQSR